MSRGILSSGEKLKIPSTNRQRSFKLQHPIKKAEHCPEALEAFPV